MEQNSYISEMKFILTDERLKENPPKHPSSELFLSVEVMNATRIIREREHACDGYAVYSHVSWHINSVAVSS